MSPSQKIVYIEFILMNPNQIPHNQQIPDASFQRLQIPFESSDLLLSQITSTIAPLPSNPESGSNRERERISSRLEGFNPRDNPVWREITHRFGSNIKQPELLSIANVLSQSARIKLDRDAKRRKTVLIKWFQENWTSIYPYLDYVVL